MPARHRLAVPRRIGVGSPPAPAPDKSASVRNNPECRWAFSWAATGAFPFHEMRAMNMTAEILAHSISDAVRISGIGRTRLYELIADGQIEARKSGNRTLVLAASLRGYLAGLPPARLKAARNATA